MIFSRSSERDFISYTRKKFLHQVGEGKERQRKLG